MQLTKNFSLAEFSQSETASKLGISNVIPTVYVSNIQALCERVLQPLRDHFRQAIRVTSGYRSPALNRAVGGVATSQHLTGEAADIVLGQPVNKSTSQQATSQRITLLRWFVWIMDNCEFDQLILEHSSSSLWIHVSYRQGKNRQQVLFG